MRSIVPTTQELALSQFEEFWKAYPTGRKVTKSSAKSKWLAIFDTPTKCRHLFPKVMESLETHKKTVQWEDPKFIPLMSTWLNQERWNKEFHPKEFTKSNGQVKSGHVDGYLERMKEERDKKRIEY